MLLQFCTSSLCNCSLIICNSTLSGGWSVGTRKIIQKCYNVCLLWAWLHTGRPGGSLRKEYSAIRPQPPCSYEPVAAGTRTTHPKPASAGNYPKSSSVNSMAITNSITSTGQHFIGVGHYHSQNTPTNSTTWTGQPFIRDDHSQDNEDNLQEA